MEKDKVQNQISSFKHSEKKYEERRYQSAMSLQQKKINIKRKNLENAIRAGIQTEELKFVDPIAFEVAQKKALQKKQIKEAE